MPAPIPQSFYGIDADAIRATLNEQTPDGYNVKLNDHDWGTAILACDDAEEPGDSIGDNLRHKYALDDAALTPDDMLQLLANLYALDRDFEVSDVWPESERDLFEWHAENAGDLVRAVLDTLGLEVV